MMKHSSIIRGVAVVLLSAWLVALPAGEALAAPMLTVIPDSGAAGAEVTITGENFDSYRGDQISIFFDNEELALSPIVVPQTGTFSFSFNVPADAAPGSHTLRARSSLGSTLALAPFTVLTPGIGLSEVLGPVGTVLTVRAQGFHANRVVNLYFNSVLLGTVTAGATGQFTVEVSVPERPAGPHVILARNAEGHSASVQFEIVPRIVLDRTSGVVGDILKVGGQGFAAGVAVLFNFEEVAFARSSDTGSFEAAIFNIPAMPPGAHEVAAEDQKGNRARAVFTIVAGISIEPATASVGTDLTVKGTGFEAGGMVEVSYDGVVVGTVTANSSGAFQFVFRVPESRHGEHVITVDDGVNVRQVAFVVEAEAPPVPLPVAPAGGTEVEVRPRFDWQDVDDPSRPVTYVLQVASDEGFASVVLQKEVGESEYRPTEPEKLEAVEEDSPYYWRVRARDAAANESEWSAPVSFLVLAPAAPALLLPADGSEAEAETYFDWEDAASLNPPVTYHLQVATDAEFARIVLEKEGLEQSSYQITEQEALEARKQAVPYYWRVRGVDGAGNPGDWSEPGTFGVAFAFSLPSWAIYILIAMGAAVIAALTFWLGRRTAYQG